MGFPNGGGGGVAVDGFYPIGDSALDVASFGMSGWQGFLNLIRFIAPVTKGPIKRMVMAVYAASAVNDTFDLVIYDANGSQLSLIANTGAQAGILNSGAQTNNFIPLITPISLTPGGIYYAGFNGLSIAGTPRVSGVAWPGASVQDAQFRGFAVPQLELAQYNLGGANTPSPAAVPFAGPSVWVAGMRLALLTY